jgi:hypothetical protein
MLKSFVFSCRCHGAWRASHEPVVTRGRHAILFRRGRPHTFSRDLPVSFTRNFEEHRSLTDCKILEPGRPRRKKIMTNASSIRHESCREPAALSCPDRSEVARQRAQRRRLYSCSTVSPPADRMCFVYWCVCRLLYISLGCSGTVQSAHSLQRPLV